MQNHYDNDFETLLERSIDENYPKPKNDENQNKGSKCPFNLNNAKNRFRSPNNFRNKKLRRVQEKSKFNSMLLPEGWIRLFHDSGMFFYCHVATKVVTWSMPYELQTEPARLHRIPVRSIPCLSVLSQTCDSNDWDKLTKPTNNNNDNNNDNKSDLNKSDHNNDATIDKETKIAQPTVVIAPMVVASDIVVDGPGEITKVSKECEEVKEDGEIESSDDNGSDELSGVNEPALPRQYQLNHHKSKHTRPKTVSTSDLVPNKRKHNNDETENSKRHRFLSDSLISDTTKKIENAQDTMPEPLIAESLDLNSRLLEPHEFHKYCEKIFQFVDEIKYVPRFIFNNKKKTNVVNNAQQGPNKPDQQQQQPQSVIETTVPATCSMKVKIPNKNLYLDLAGRNFSCILNMYCQHAYNLIPIFKSTSSMGGIHDFEVICEINNSIYGVGEGRTKKIAKQKSIVKTLEILIPGFMQKINDGSDKTQSIDPCVAGSSQSSLGNSDAPDDLFALFDIMEITDPRVFSYATKLNSIAPYNLLTECMNRHCVSDSEIKCKIEKEDKHNVFKLIIGEKAVQTKCENKREGRQLAAQYMLAKLHPHIQSWGGILRLYGPGSKPVKRFDMQDMQNLLLEDRGGVKNNLINLLRKKMLDLNDEYQGSADKSKAKFRTSFQTIPIIVFHPDSATIIPGPGPSSSGKP